jgi:predicted nucleotidyltransferase component of viral defense system
MIRPVSINRLTASYGGRFRDAAYVELAQEHLLHWMFAEGLIHDEDVVFKGGSALRKFVFGAKGRFSVDLDFTINDRYYGEHILTALQYGLQHEGVRFSIVGDVDMEALKASWRAEVPSQPNLGRTSFPSRLDFSSRATMLRPEARARAQIFGMEARYLEFDPVLIPVMALVENSAEKLARFRRLILARDAYDLSLLAEIVRGQLPLLREVLLYKVYFDMVVDRRGGTAPFRLGSEYSDRGVGEVIDAADLASLTAGRPDFAGMLHVISQTFGGMLPASGEFEGKLAQCSPGDRYLVEQRMMARRDELRQYPASRH